MLYKMKGFTLIEVLVSLALLAIVSGIVFISFSDLSDANALDSSVSNTVARLNEARSKTLSSKEDMQYGVHLQSDSIISFAGSSYVIDDPSNKSYDLNNAVEISNISIAGGSDIVFDRLTGQTDNIGTFSIRLKDDINASSTIKVFGTGIIQVGL